MTAQEDDEVLARLIEEFRGSKAAGKTPDISAAAEAHPTLARELRQLWATVEFLEEISSKEDSYPLTNAMGETQDNFPRAFGNYELLQVIGSGGMGIVYKARQKTLQRIVALKLIRKWDSASAADLARFKSEALVASRISHPNVVQVLDAGTVDDQPFYVMPYLEGETLAQRLARGPLREDEAARIVSILAKAVQSAHESGLLHRDLKPSNIIFDRAGVPHVSDFGLAKFFGNESGDSIVRHTQTTASGAILGTPGYMAPEQISKACGEPGPASDVYALGAMLYEMLTGRPPFRAATVMETLLLVLDQEPVRPVLLVPKINPGLELVCLKCLQKRPDTRYPSAQKWAQDLDSWREHGPLSVRLTGWTGLVPLFSRIFRETQHAVILENWGLLWMWHGAMVFALCLLTWGVALAGLDQPLGLMGLWGGGLALWGAISWQLRIRGGPVFFIEKQVAHIWAGSVFAVIGVFLTEMILGMDSLALSPLLAVIAGMMFVAKAGMLSGEFYVYAALNYIAVIPMAWSMAMFPAWHLNQLILALFASLGFILPGIRYYRQAKHLDRSS